MTDRNDVVVTGFSLVSPLGLTVADFTRRMFGGESGIRDLAPLLAPGEEFPVRCAGFLPEGVYPDLADCRYGDEVKNVIRVLLEACLAQERRWRPVDGVVYGTSAIPRLGDVRRAAAPGAGAASDWAHLRPEFGLEHALETLRGAGQPDVAPDDSIVCANGCITGLAAISYALKRIRLGLNKRVLVICDETRIRKEELLKYNALGALSREACPPESASRPFTKSRSGFVKGEGAGLMILESRASAEEAGVETHAAIAGYGQSADAWRLTEGREDLDGATAAMRQALADAGIGPEKIDYINAHGTSTPKNDLLETAAIKRVFGRRAYDVPVSSLKSQIGHLNYACGMVESIASVIMLKSQTLAPTINHHDPDPDCDLYYVPNKSEPRKIDHVLKNSFGFGGANAAMVFKKE